MRSPIGYRPPNDAYWAVRIPTYIFNFLQWVAVTSLIIYAGEKSHSIFLEVLGGLLEGLLITYATAITVDRIQYRFLDAGAQSWKAILLSLAIGVALTLSLEVAIFKGVADIIAVQSCSG